MDTKTYTLALTFTALACIGSHNLSYAESAKAYALLSPKNQATLSSEINAKIIEIPVKDAENFKQGETLIQLDCRTFNAELQKAVAEETSTEIGSESAHQLEELDSGSTVEVAEAKAAHHKAVAEVARLKAVVSHCSIKAPYDGEVKNILVHSHEVVQPSQPLIEIVDNKHFEVKLFVPSPWLKWLKVGSSFQVHFDEIGQTFPAVVSKLGAQVDAASQTIKVYGNLEKTSPRLIAGMSGEATFKGSDS